MNASKDTKQTSSQDHTLRMILMIAACFAVGSIGFFVAVLLQHTTQPSLQTSQAQEVEAQVKSAAMQSLAASEPTPTPTATSTPAAGAHPAAVAPAVSPQQADTNDANAAAKLKVLEQLSSH